MKLFETPVAKVIELNALDIARTSGCTTDGDTQCPDDMGEF